MTESQFPVPSLSQLRSAFTVIDQEQRPAIFGYLSSQAVRGRFPVADIDDALQETRARLWRAIRRGKFPEAVWEPQSATNRREIRLWQFGTARNVMHEFRRRAERRRQILLAAAANLPNDAAMPTTEEIDLREIIELCPGREREVARLLLSGWTIQEIAAVQRLHRSTIHRRLKALRRLWSAITAEEHLDAAPPA